MKKILFSVFIIILALAFLYSENVIKLKDGRVLSGKVIKRGNIVTINGNQGLFQFPDNEIEKVEGEIEIQKSTEDVLREMKSDTLVHNNNSVVQNAADTNSNIVVIETKFGKIEIELFPDIAPKHVANFKTLVKKNFYNGLLFHRVIPGFVIQGGDPKGDGSGGPGYTIEAEISDKVKHLRGTVAAARLGDAVNPQKKSSGSQFYICLNAQPTLDNKYSIFGRVIKGMDVADKIGNVKRDEKDKPVEPVKMEKVYLKNSE